MLTDSSGHGHILILQNITRKSATAMRCRLFRQLRHQAIQKDRLIAVNELPGLVERDKPSRVDLPRSTPRRDIGPGCNEEDSQVL